MRYQKHKSAIYCEDEKCEGCLQRRFRINLPFVKYLVRKHFYHATRPGYYGNDRDMDDMLQAGRMGLWHACARRDPSRSEADFRGYAAVCIRGYILISLRDLGKDAYSRANEGARPSMRSVDFDLDVRRNEGHREERQLREAHARIVDRQYELGNRPWWDLNTLVDDKWDRLRAAMDSLDARGREILEARLAEESLQKVATRLGLSRERVRQLQEKALSQVYHRINSTHATNEKLKDMVGAFNMFENG